MAQALDEEHAKQLGLEKEVVDELGAKYDDLIDFLLLLALSERTSRQRKKQIAAAKLAQYKAYNKAFSERAARKAYELGKNQAYREVGAKIQAMSGQQEKELSAFVGQLNADLDSRLAVYDGNFKKLSYRTELASLRAEVLGFADKKVKKTELLFMDSKGRRISNSAIMSVGPGDIIWDAMESGKRTVYLSLGITEVEHISVIDDRTTEICISLHRKRRDLTKDKIPPMHRRCRSKIRAIDPQTGKPFIKK